MLGSSRRTCLLNALAARGGYTHAIDSFENGRAGGLVTVERVATERDTDG